MGSDEDGGAQREEHERDELLKKLLKTPPQPRPKREREDKPKRDSRQTPKGKESQTSSDK